MGHASAPTQAECCLLDLQHMSSTVPLICVCAWLCAKHWGVSQVRPAPWFSNSLQSVEGTERENGTHREQFCRDALVSLYQQSVVLLSGRVHLGGKHRGGDDIRGLKKGFGIFYEQPRGRRVFLAMRAP